MVLGIDIGTSRIKVSLINNDLKHHISFAPTPNVNAITFQIDLNEIWNQIEITIHDVLKKARCSSKIQAICVSTQTPTICIFDKRYPQKSIGISYLVRNSIALKFNLQNHIDRSKITHETLRLFKPETLFKPKSFICCTLTGYINYRFSNCATIDSISKWELGLDDQSHYSHEFFQALWALKETKPTESIGQIVSNTQRLLEGATVLGGTTDTVASLYGASFPSSKYLIYLGTFGSLLSVAHEPLEYSFSKDIDPPYKWLLSIPNLGPEILRNSLKYSSSFDTFLNKGLTQKPGCNGQIVNLPWWENNMERGEYVALKELQEASLVARMYCEGIGFFMRLVVENYKIPISEIILTGGICNNPAFREMFTDAFSHTAKFAKVCDGSFGAALIALNQTGQNCNREYVTEFPNDNSIAKKNIDISFQNFIKSQKY